jgi:hypothetical protein
MSLKNTIEESVQGNLKIGGRGLDRIKHVVHYTDRDKYTLSIKTGDQVMSLNMAEHELACMGDSRVPPFLKIELSKNAANKIRKAIESEFEVEQKEL